MKFQNIVTKKGYVYILSNFKRNVLYTGVTSDIVKRIWEHRMGNGSVFTKKYNLVYLVYYEEFKHIERAIDREKQLKNWHREWKFNLIKSKNPEMKDLWPLIRR
ncbi:MAG: GIY-YIG nuclease family protein [Balneolaceae bacterium]|nr:GIY-YIG nuclease family protein [Balneolaceae bacterium]